MVGERPGGGAGSPEPPVPSRSGARLGVPPPPPSLASGTPRSLPQRSSPGTEGGVSRAPGALLGPVPVSVLIPRSSPAPFGSVPVSLRSLFLPAPGVPSPSVLCPSAPRSLCRPQPRWAPSPSPPVPHRPQRSRPARPEPPRRRHGRPHHVTATPPARDQLRQHHVAPLSRDTHPPSPRGSGASGPRGAVPCPFLSPYPSLSPGAVPYLCLSPGAVPRRGARVTARHLLLRHCPPSAPAAHLYRRLCRWPACSVNTELFVLGRARGHRRDAVVRQRGHRSVVPFRPVFFVCNGVTAAGGQRSVPGTRGRFSGAGVVGCLSFE